MGEIADAIISGEICELCLTPFVNPKKLDQYYEHGYPVVCSNCWNELTEEQKKHHQKAHAKTI